MFPPQNALALESLVGRVLKLRIMPAGGRLREFSHSRRGKSMVPEVRCPSLTQSFLPNPCERTLRRLRSKAKALNREVREESPSAKRKRPDSSGLSRNFN